MSDHIDFEVIAEAIDRLTAAVQAQTVTLDRGIGDLSDKLVALEERVGSLGNSMHRAADKIVEAIDANTVIGEGVNAVGGLRYARRYGHEPHHEPQ